MFWKLTRDPTVCHSPVFLLRCSKLSRSKGRATWAQRAKSYTDLPDLKVSAKKMWRDRSIAPFLMHVHSIFGLKWTFQLWTIQDRPRRSRRNIYCHHLPLCRPSLVTTTLVVMGFVLASETESDVIMIRGVEDMTSRRIGYANHSANHARLPFHDVNFHSLGAVGCSIDTHNDGACIRSPLQKRQSIIIVMLRWKASQFQ